MGGDPGEVLAELPHGPPFRFVTRVAELSAGFDGFAHGFCASAVAFHARQATGICPASIAIHDDGDVSRNIVG